MSLITLSQKPAVFNSYGVLADSRAVQKTGYWAVQQICDLLPITYVP